MSGEQKSLTHLNLPAGASFEWRGIKLVVILKDSCNDCYFNRAGAHPGDCQRSPHCTGPSRQFVEHSKYVAMKLLGEVR